jgi:hypothetical protein
MSVLAVWDWAEKLAKVGITKNASSSELEAFFRWEII